MKSILQFKGGVLTMFTALVLLVIASCNKKFDEPPLNADPDIPVTMTIAQLKAKYAAIGNFQTVQDDKVISGIVTADDRTGNFYKQIVIQDETGGIPIIIDMNSLYTMYPVGRRVYVKVKGLMLGDYGGTIQLGLDSTRSTDGRYLNLGRIPETLLNTYIVKGSFGNAITPKLVKPSEFTGAINDPLISAFVQINSAEFKDADLVKTYANATAPTTESARNFTIKPCNDTKSIVLRNSSYATFAGLTVPQGNGPLVGIASVFNGTIQMTIRDTSDVQFKGPRCNGQVPTGVTKTITEVLQYATGDSTIPGGVWIEGVIVSDTKNEAAGNYRLQDGTSGIQIRFANGSNPSPGALGDKLKVYVGGYKFSIFSGGLQINGPDVSTTTGTGTVTPRVATIAEITTNMRAWESTVVTINNVTISGSGTNYTITDATGSLATFVRTSSGITMPTAATSITGYVTVFKPTGGADQPQITLRTVTDIVGGTTTPPSSGGGIDLGTTSPLLINFDNIGSGLPTGVKVYNAALPTALGTEVTLTTAATAWNNTSAAFKNFASATGLVATTAVADQNTATNRALGVRQTGTAGWDGGTAGGPAFVFMINNTSGKSNLKLDFLLQSLDGTTAVARTTTWTVEYFIGETPATFTTIATSPATLTTTFGTFASTSVHVDLPAALNNLTSKVWLRISASTATTGSGSRPSTAIDDVKFSW